MTTCRRGGRRGWRGRRRRERRGGGPLRCGEGVETSFLGRGGGGGVGKGGGGGGAAGGGRAGWRVPGGGSFPGDLAAQAGRAARLGAAGAGAGGRGVHRRA